MKSDIPGIELGDILGRGGMGIVYAGSMSGRPVAVKVVPAAQDFAARALQEGAVGWSLDHPHVVRVITYGTLPDGAVYLVMERLSGETLAQRLRRRGPMEGRESVAIMRQLAAALNVIHGRGAVHRDVKPSNVFLCDDGVLPDQVKLLDLGVARLAFDDPARQLLTADGMLLGTASYMAPEYVRGEPVDGRADLYSLGLVWYECVTGQRFNGSGTSIDRLRAVAGRTLPVALPVNIAPAVRPVLARCLAPDAMGRPASAAALAEELAALDQPGEGAKTVIDLGDRRLPLDGLNVPTQGDVGEQVRFRRHIIMAVATLYRPGHLPPAIQGHLDEIERLHARRAALIGERDQARAAADAHARDLATRLAENARRQAEAQADDSESREATRLTTRLIRLAEDIGALDRGYVRRYRALESLHEEAARQASARGAPVTLDALYDERAGALLAELDQLQRERAEHNEAQRSVRDALGALRGKSTERTRALRDLHHQHLTLEAERDLELAGLEAAARDAEDALLVFDRTLEHVYLALGVVLQADLSGRRKALA